MSDKLPAGWAESTIGDITAYVSRGKSPKYTQQSTLPVVNQKAIRWHGIQNVHLKFVHEDQFEQWGSERFIRAGDVLWNSTGTGTIGRACLVNLEQLETPKVVDSHVTVVRPNFLAIDPRFLFAWIRGPIVQNGLEELASGSTNQIELNRSTVVGTRIPLAPLPEQKRIADKLDALLARVDACRERLDRVPKILKRFRQSVLAAATSGGLTREWREERGLAAWRPTSVADVAAKVFDGPFGSHLKSNDYTDAGIRVVRLENIAALDFIEEKRTYISRLKYESLIKHTLFAGDILFSSFVDEEVRVCLLPAHLDGNAVNKADCFCIRTNDQCCRSAFLAFRLACTSTFEALDDVVHGATRPRINIGHLKQITFELPSLDEQDEVIKRTNALLQLADALDKRLSNVHRNAGSLTAGILAKAFRGELVLQDPNDEPASELLARIRAQVAVAGSKPKRGKA